MLLNLHPWSHCIASFLGIKDRLVLSQSPHQPHGSTLARYVLWQRLPISGQYLTTPEGGRVLVTAWALLLERLVGPLISAVSSIQGNRIRLVRTPSGPASSRQGWAVFASTVRGLLTEVPGKTDILWCRRWWVVLIVSSVRAPVFSFLLAFVIDPIVTGVGVSTSTLQTLASEIGMCWQCWIDHSAGARWSADSTKGGFVERGSCQAVFYRLDENRCGETVHARTSYRHETNPVLEISAWTHCTPCDGIFAI